MVISGDFEAKYNVQHERCMNCKYSGRIFCGTMPILVCGKREDKNGDMLPLVVAMREAGNGSPCTEFEAKEK